MRILRVISSVDPAAGGPVEGLIRSSAALERLGHETEVVTADAPQSPWLTGFPFAVHALGPSTKPYAYTPRLAGWLKRHAAEYDVAVLHGIWNYGSFGGWRGLADGPTPYVLFTHGMLDPWFKHAYPLKHRAKQLYWLAIEGRVLRDASRVLFTTEEERRLAEGVFWGHSYRGAVVNYGTGDPPPASPVQAEARRAALPALGDRAYLLFLSRIHPKKGCDLLIDAFAAIADRRLDLDLVMAGPDQVGWRSELEKRAPRLAGRIHWPGLLTGEAKWGALRGAEAFVLPSHQENFGIVVAEAMACGTPVLITDKVNIWREVEKSGGGLVSTDTGEGVGELLKSFLRFDRDARDQMAKRARAGFLQSFEIGKAASSLAGVLEEVRTESKDARRAGR